MVVVVVVVVVKLVIAETIEVAICLEKTTHLR